MQIALGKYGAFWLFMCFTLVGLVFVYFFLPETKGRTLEDIEKLFSKKFNQDGTVVIQPKIEDQQSNNVQQIRFNSSLGTVEMGKEENGNSLTTKPKSYRSADSEDEEDNVIITGPVPTPI